MRGRGRHQDGCRGDCGNACPRAPRTTDPSARPGTPRGDRIRGACCTAHDLMLPGPTAPAPARYAAGAPGAVLGGRQLSGPAVTGLEQMPPFAWPEQVFKTCVAWQPHARPVRRCAADPVRPPGNLPGGASRGGRTRLGGLTRDSADSKDARLSRRGRSAAWSCRRSRLLRRRSRGCGGSLRGCRGRMRLRVRGRARRRATRSCCARRFSSLP